MGKMKFGSKSGTGFVAPTKSITQGTTAHASALKKDPNLGRPIEYASSETTRLSTTEYNALIIGDLPFIMNADLFFLNFGIIYLYL